MEAKPKKTLSKSLRALRAERGYSQEYVAKRLNISQKTYSRWENEAEALSHCELEAICVVLKVKPQELMQEDETNLHEEVQSLRKEVINLQNIVNQLITPPPILTSLNRVV